MVFAPILELIYAMASPRALSGWNAATNEFSFEPHGDAATRAENLSRVVRAAGAGAWLSDVWIVRDSHVRHPVPGGDEPRAPGDEPRAPGDIAAIVSLGGGRALDADDRQAAAPALRELGDRLFPDAGDAETVARWLRRCAPRPNPAYPDDLNDRELLAVAFAVRNSSDPLVIDAAADVVASLSGLLSCDALAAFVCDDRVSGMFLSCNAGQLMAVVNAAHTAAHTAAHAAAPSLTLPPIVI